MLICYQCYHIADFYIILYEMFPNTFVCIEIITEDYEKLKTDNTTP